MKKTTYKEFIYDLEDDELIDYKKFSAYNAKITLEFSVNIYNGENVSEISECLTEIKNVLEKNIYTFPDDIENILKISTKVTEISKS